MPVWGYNDKEFFRGIKFNMKYFIDNYSIDNIGYTEPAEFFYTLERSYKPSLLTGEGPQDISGESIIGINPVEDIIIDSLSGIWDTLRELNNSINFETFEYPINRLGAIGFISYEALHSLENIEKKTNDHFDFPYLNWTIYNEYYYFDNLNRKAWKINLNYINPQNFTVKYIKNSDFKDTGFEVKNLIPDVTPDRYRQNVEKVRELIKEGEIYELNLTQGILGDFSGSPLSLFKKLYKENSAPYSAYLEREDFVIVSNSPELFLRVDGKKVQTRPIKGTAPRSNSKKIDDELQKELLNSEKNQAELYMIVDLMRNDLSKVCEIGSVKVINKKRVEKYKNVHHLVSIIKGQLKINSDIIDLLKATFPGGSITGCPKVRCMELTEEIEKSSRNLYTGTIFIMNKEYLNSSIVIRSAVIKDKKIVFNSGGAVTIDSDPLDEYNESLIKLKSIFKAVNCADYL